MSEDVAAVASESPGGATTAATGRLLFRAVVLSACTALAWASLLAAALLARSGLVDLRRCRAAIFRRWARFTTRVLGIAVQVVGTAPPSPCFLVCNHLSYVDIVVLATQVPAIFVAKSEVSSWPAIGSICSAAGTLFVDRTSRRDVLRANRQITEALAAGYNVILFPEGTSTRGTAVAPFRASLLAPAAASDLPLYCASLSYSTPVGQSPADVAVCWWGEMEFGPHVRGLLRLPRFEAHLSFSETPMSDRDRKALADRLHGAVSEMFVPVDSVSTDRARR